MATMKYCPRCAATIQHNASFCITCGHRLEGHATPGDDSSVTGREQAVGIESSYMIPLERILFMSVISHGLYILYWLFLTWKHYRDHTGEEAFPYWHAMTQTVPIYSFFRVHAHMRVFTELMRKEELTTTISPGWAVIAVLVSGTLGSVSLGNEGEITQGTAISMALLDTFAVAILACLLLHVQANLNRYWSHRSGSKPLDAKVGVGVGEAIIAVIGGLAWLHTLANLFSAAYRSAQ
jgi:hypothetical protein